MDFVVKAVKSREKGEQLWKALTFALVFCRLAHKHNIFDIGLLGCNTWTCRSMVTFRWNTLFQSPGQYVSPKLPINPHSVATQKSNIGIITEARTLNLILHICFFIILHKAIPARKHVHEWCLVCLQGLKYLLNAYYLIVVVNLTHDIRTMYLTFVQTFVCKSVEWIIFKHMAGIWSFRLNHANNHHIWGLCKCCTFNNYHIWARSWRPIIKLHVSSV
jgi:hypothetical protein